MDIETFKLEEWLKKRESKTRFNLAENCVYAVTLDDFFHIARIDKKSFLNDFCSIKMDYGNIDGGTPELKTFWLFTVQPLPIPIWYGLW